MKIIFWNCNGAFRKKWQAICKYNADVYIIAECENLALYNFTIPGYRFIWTGKNKSKGLAVFFRDIYSLGKTNFYTDDSLQLFLPVIIDGKPIVAIWAKDPYIEAIYDWLVINDSKIDEDVLLIGDFNSNVCWDKEHKRKNHSVVSNWLFCKRLVSVYHYLTGDKPGEEQQDTFFLYRKQNKGYHIDYAFCNKDSIVNFRIGKYEEYLRYSDHMPVFLELK